MLAIIPARGGSKRLPGKNIKLLNGKPLIAYTIEAALKSKYITKVLVSTDCDEIAKVAIEYGAIVPELRPDYLASDSSSSNDVILYTLNLLKQKYCIDYSQCILLQPTSPLRTSKHIDEAIELFNIKKAHAVISLCKEHHPLRWNKYVSDDLILENINFLDDRVSYYPNGAIYVLSEVAIKTGLYYTDKTVGYIMDRLFSTDIDTRYDWDIAETIVEKINKN